MAESVKVWDLETGVEIFSFSDAHDDGAVNCLAMDPSGRRLMTGGQDGNVKIWNYNNGHCLQTLRKESSTQEVSDLLCLEMNKNRYVVAVGWDRSINVYVDNQIDNLHRVTHPSERWHDDIESGHKDDILCVAQCKPNLLATSSYDGQVIVWNVVSGHIFCHLSPDEPPGYQHQSMDKDMSVNAVVFLPDRSNEKNSAQVVSSGPWGHLHFWAIFEGGKLMAQFSAVEIAGAMITSMVVNRRCTVLYTADDFGFIKAWHVEGYCVDGPESAPAETLYNWRAHVDSVTKVCYVDKHNGVVISSSLDQTVRIWTAKGEYIGTYGQSKCWDLLDASTFLHPMVPYDVLIDPLSLPQHTALRHAQAMEKLARDSNKEIITDEKKKQEQHRALIAEKVRKQWNLSDDDIDRMVAERPFNKGTGKRLRHEKLKARAVNRGGPSEYQMLRYYDLQDMPDIQEPDFKLKTKGQTFPILGTL